MYDDINDIENFLSQALNWVEMTPKYPLSIFIYDQDNTSNKQQYNQEFLFNILLTMNQRI